MRFVNRLMRKNRNFSKMNLFHYNIIQDLASAQAYQQIAQNSNMNFWLKNAKPSRAYKYFRRVATRIIRSIKQTYLYAQFLKLTILIPVIEPNNQVKLIWDMILAVIRIFLLVIISIESAFNNKALYNQLAAPFYISIVFLVLDIIINCLTSYYKKGVLVQSHSKIFIKYLKSGFIFDIICISLLLMAIIEEVKQPTQYIDYLHQDERRNGSLRGLFSVTAIILQLKNVIHLFVRLQSIQDFSNATARLLDLIKLVLFLLIVEHLFSCIWYYTAFTQAHAGVQKTWLSAQSLNDSPYFDQYICAFYFATVTMVTVGYGDIVAQNTIERIVTICFMFLSTLQLSYTISTIWTIYSQFTEKKEESLKNMRAINTYMNNMNISTKLKYKIREYLQYYWKEQHIEESQDLQSILDHIPDELQDQLSFEANSMVVEGCILFRNNFSHNFKRECLQNLESMTLTPNSLITLQGSTIYFVERGEITVHYPMHKTPLCQLKKGENFGMREFVMGSEMNLNFSSTGFSKLLCLNRNKIQQILTKYPKDLELFSLLKDDMIFRDSVYGNFCYSCQSILHHTNQCPLITVNTDKIGIIKKIQYPTIQPRFKQKRCSNRSKTMLIKDDLKEYKTSPSLGLDEARIELDLNISITKDHQEYFTHQINSHKSELFQQQSYSRQGLEQYSQQQSFQQTISFKEIKIDVIDSMEIDKVREFKTYFPQFNITRIINNEPIVLPLEFQTIWTKLSQYLQYPFMFIQYYIIKHRKYRKALIISENFKKNEEEMKRSQKKKTIMITRNVKQSQ